MPIEPGTILGSVGPEVPFVMMLFPLQPGYTMTVCADASDQVATTKTSSVRRNIVALIQSDKLRIFLLFITA